MTILSCRERRPDLRALRLPLGAPAPGRLPPWGMMGILSQGARATGGPRGRGSRLRRAGFPTRPPRYVYEEEFQGDTP